MIPGRKKGRKRTVPLTPEQKRDIIERRKKAWGGMGFAKRTEPKPYK